MYLFIPRKTYIFRTNILVFVFESKFMEQVQKLMQIAVVTT